MTYQQIVWSGVGYLIVGALIWMQIAFDNSMERQIKQRNKYVPIKFLKTVAFWLPYLFFRKPNSNWMCK